MRILFDWLVDIDGDRHIGDGDDDDNDDDVLFAIRWTIR